MRGPAGGAGRPRTSRVTVRSGGELAAAAVLELALDLGELGVGALDLRSLEAGARPAEVVDEQEDDRRRP